MTFEESFCAAHHVDAAAFRWRVFWRTVPPWRLPLALTLRWLSRDCFRADDELLYGVGEARTLEEVRRETGDYLNRPVNQRWLRRVARIRISRRRMLQLAENYVGPGKPARSGGLRRGPADPRGTRSYP